MTLVAGTYLACGTGPLYSLGSTCMTVYPYLSHLLPGSGFYEAPLKRAEPHLFSIGEPYV